MIKNYNEPFNFFASWFDQAKGRVADLEVVTIAIADEQNQPEMEMGKLKEFNQNSFKIISNSKKIHQNSKIAVCIYWSELGYQIRIEGIVEQVDGIEIAIDINAIEFWEDGKHRLHKRYFYRKTADKRNWELRKLYP